MARILVADSDPVLREAATAALRPHNVLTAPDAVRALEETGRWKPDLVVLGTFPGRRCGTATCNRIKNDPRMGRTPVLMLCPSRNGRKDTCRCKGDRCLVRPFRGQDLATLADSLLNPRLPL